MNHTIFTPEERLQILEVEYQILAKKLTEYTVVKDRWFEVMREIHRIKTDLGDVVEEVEYE